MRMLRSGMIARVLLAAGGAMTLSACASGSAMNAPETASVAQARVATITVQQLGALIEAGQVVLIDVRTPYEFADGRIAGALNAPLTHFDAAAMPVDETREIILYCGSSRRSGIAAEALAEHRGMVVRHLEGGIRSWTEAGMPTIANQPSDDPRS